MSLEDFGLTLPSDLRKIVTRFIVQLRTPPLYLAANRHWVEDQKHALKFKTFVEASWAMGSYDCIIKTIEVKE